MTVPPLRRILCVEDEADIQVVVKLALESIGGFEVRLCSSGKEAVAVAVATAPQLVLLDVMMPGMDGPTTLRALRALPELEKVPVAFMTAKIQPQEVASLKALGAVDVIAKPFDPMNLSAQVEAVWRAAHA